MAALSPEPTAGRLRAGARLSVTVEHVVSGTLVVSTNFGGSSFTGILIDMAKKTRKKSAIEQEIKSNLKCSLLWSSCSAVAILFPGLVCTVFSQTSLSSKRSFLQSPAPVKSLMVKNRQSVKLSHSLAKCNFPR
ncbi:uncharacterized protein pwwp2b [Scyliorhinus canicula]|uniref:uncharacterized protein pwwp2b n=1 Tax=Scyliorhinus canicula TaxID=7830 RepID=UPI0018F4EB25|nr:uncharacterized protein pwwp2b [Scyliorhinus canicula]